MMHCTNTTFEDGTMVRSAGNIPAIIRFQLQSMASLVEKALHAAIAALVAGDPVRARGVIDGDKAINSFEIDIDNTTFNALTLSGGNLPPDMLRRILAFQKINPMLERIGDHAVNIAESTIALTGSRQPLDLFGIPAMADTCKKALANAVTSFFNDDQSLAAELLTGDDMVDEMNNAVAVDIKNALMNDPEKLSLATAFEMINIAKNLERIADLAMNIAEEAMYVIEGTVVKHREAIG